MTFPSRLALTGGLAAAVVCVGAVPAGAATSCGNVGRPFTDGAPTVTITKGSISCATARGVMRKYWSRSVDAFSRTVRLRYRGIRWVCRPTTSIDVPNRWACRGGGPARNRFRVTARE